MDKEFWDKSDAPSEGISEEEFHKAEELLNIKLPRLYRELLKIQNGGYTCRFAFPTQQENTWSETHVPFYQLSGIDFKSFNESKSVLINSEYYRKEWELDDDIYLLLGEGHWWIVLDYRRKKSEPQISWVESEMEQDFVIAETFQEFINGLKLEEEFDDDRTDN